MHQRAQIKAAVKNLLLGNTSAEDRVYVQRFYSVDKNDELPVIVIYCLEEPVERDNELQQKREAKVFVEATVGSKKKSDDTEGDDDPLDVIANEIEAVLVPAETAGDSCAEFYLSNTEYDYDETSSRLIGAVRLTFIAEYYTDRFSVADEDPAFETAASTIVTGDPEEVISEDVTELPQ